MVLKHLQVLRGGTVNRWMVLCLKLQKDVFHVNLGKKILSYCWKLYAAIEELSGDGVSGD